MTIFERAQPRQVFSNAGRTAFHMLILQSANPYPNNDRKSFASWDYGWRTERENFEAKERANRPVKKFTKFHGAETGRIRSDRPNQSNSGRPNAR